MPSSYIDSVPPIVKALVDLDPHHVLDIGPGWGKFGLLCREYLPHLERLWAIEVPEGRRSTQDVIYDEVIERDVRTVMPEAFLGFDVVLLIDVIEHMTLSEGRDLLRAIQRQHCRVLVSTPQLFVDQHDEHNPYETHVSLWDWQTLRPHDIELDVSTIDSIIYVLAAQ